MVERDAPIPPKVLTAWAAGIALTFAALGFTEAWSRLELRGFDELTVATAPNASSFPITIVAIDEDSFAQVKKQWPWPHSLHGRLIDELAKAGALVIALDVLLAEPDRGGAAEDRALADAIARAGNVVLAAEMAYIETAYARQWLRVDPLPELKAAGARNGFARIDLDRDTVARRIPREDDAFWREIAKVAAQRMPGIRVQEPQPGAMIRYAGPIQTFQYVPYYQALNPETLPPDVFKDQVVIVGRHVRASPDAHAANPDVFATPFLASTGWFTPGAEIHAHILETALRGDAVMPVPAEWNAALVVAMVAAAAFLMRRWRPVVSALTAAGLILPLAALDWVLFTRFNLWLPAAAAAFAVLAVYLSYGGIAYLVAQFRRAELRRAFSLYVSPEVVEHVMANPERLKLGGEHRDVTLLFTDLAGFTTITEQHGAEQVTRILNMHFSRATAIIKSHRGTVNRFIGDAIMATWGAPVDDPKQALNAVRAACEMQKDMALLREELTAQGLPPIHMRVGIHSCNAILGNLGSADRFEYTAIGDGVNLAARLEGVNKLYRTGILLSGETAALLEGALPVRVVDRVIVKGKHEPVDIFTPCEDAVVAELSDLAIKAYRARRWEEAEGYWREVEKRMPGDGVAAIHLERVAECKALPPDPAWKDVVELEKL